MLRIRIAQLVFLFLFVAVTKANAITIFTANLTRSQENILTNSATIETVSKPPSFWTAGFVLNDAANTPFGFGLGGPISGKWDPREGNSATLLAQLPEPAAVILLGIGILIVGFVCRRGLRKR